MRKFLNKLVDWMEHKAIAGSEVGRFDGIGLADVRWRKESQKLFRQTMEAALELVRDRDPRRYARIKRHIKWIVNRLNNTMGAEYDHRTCACNIEFGDIPGLEPHLLAALCASILVHEATHGAIASRGIETRKENCVRIERLCTAEQNRFVARLASLDPEAYPLRLLHWDFDERAWDWEWTASPGQRRRAFLSRLISDIRAEPDGAGNTAKLGS